jgi:hypothetical protein
MRVPLLADDGEANELSMFPGKFYQYTVSRLGDILSHKGEPLWKTPGGHTGNEDILIHIPKGKPFMFVNLEIEGAVGRQDSGPGRRCWLRVVYGDLVGFINVNTFCLHDLIEPVDTEE